MERWNAVARGTITFGRDIRRAVACDLMGNEEKNLDVSGGKVAIDARPYEILTIRLEFE